MARPDGTSRVIIEGTLPGGESFAWGFWMDFAPGSQPSTQILANGVRDEFNTNAKTALAGLLGPEGSYDRVNVYSYPSGTGGAAFNAVANIASGTGTGTTPLHPLQCAWVVSLRTGLPGRARRGRMYIPVNVLTLVSYQMSTGSLTSLLGSVTDFINGVDNLGLGGVVAVVSSVGTGQKNAVIQLSADTRLDIQRRRAASETVVSSATGTITP